MKGLDPARAHTLLGVVLVLLVGAGGYLVYLRATSEGRHRDPAAEEAADRRRSSVPSPPPAPAPPLRLSLARAAAEAGRPAGLRVAFGSDAWTLEDGAPVSREDEVWAEVTRAIRRAHAQRPEASGEIAVLGAPAPGEISEALRTRALGAFIAADVVDVSYAGAEAGTPR